MHQLLAGIFIEIKDIIIKRSTEIEIQWIVDFPVLSILDHLSFVTNKTDRGLWVAPTVNGQHWSHVHAVQFAYYRFLYVLFLSLNVADGWSRFECYFAAERAAIRFPCFQCLRNPHSANQIDAINISSSRWMLGKIRDFLVRHTGCWEYFNIQ